MPEFTTTRAAAALSTEPLELLIRSALETTVAAGPEYEDILPFFASAAAYRAGVRATPQDVSQRHQHVQCDMQWATHSCDCDGGDDGRCDLYVDEDDGAGGTIQTRIRSDTEKSGSPETVGAAMYSASSVFEELQPLIEKVLTSVVQKAAGPDPPESSGEWASQLAQELLKACDVVVKAPPQLPTRVLPVVPGDGKRGVLTLRLHSAEGLRAADLNGKSDPYVVIRFGNEKELRSTVKDRTLKPMWNETFALGVHPLSTVVSTSITLKVFDQDKRRMREAFSSTDDPLGECTVLARELEQAEWHDYKMPLTKKGHVSFTLSFEPKASEKPVEPKAAEEALEPKASGCCDSAVQCCMPQVSNETGGCRRLKFRGDGSYVGRPRTDQDMQKIALMVGIVSEDVCALDLGENIAVTVDGLEKLRASPGTAPAKRASLTDRLFGASVRSLPFLFPCLRELSLAGCSAIVALPQWLCELRELEQCSLKGCSKLVTLPDAISNLGTLQSLDLSWCKSLRSLPGAMGALSSLKRLHLAECHNLTTPRSTLPDLSAIAALRIVSAPPELDRWVQQGCKQVKL